MRPLLSFLRRIFGREEVTEEVVSAARIPAGAPEEGGFPPSSGPADAEMAAAPEFSGEVPSAQGSGLELSGEVPSARGDGFEFSGEVPSAQGGSFEFSGEVPGEGKSSFGFSGREPGEAFQPSAGESGWKDVVGSSERVGAGGRENTGLLRESGTEQRGVSSRVETVELSGPPADLGRELTEVLRFRRRMGSTVREFGEEVL